MLRRAWWVWVVVSFVVCGCEQSKPPTAAAERELVVFAAASLRDAFTALGEDFERAEPGVKVAFNFAGSQELRTQLEHGARADVFASADQRHMQALVSRGRVEPSRVFAQNEPVIVVAKEHAHEITSLGDETFTLRVDSDVDRIVTSAGIHGEITSLADLPRASRIVIGANEVPIGRYTREILTRAGRAQGSDFRARVEAKVVSRELNVRQVLAKVSLGEAQAGVVYRSDARTARDRVAVVTIAPETNVIADYPIAVVADSPHAELARQWIALVLSTEGQRVLSEHGFTP